MRARNITRIFPLKAWFNEQRAKEDGQKIRRVLRHKMEAGTLLIKPFYGYRPGEAGRLVPDEQTASVVRWIFQQAQLGRGSGEIAGALNRKGLPTPSQAAGYERAAACWNAQHIRQAAGLSQQFQANRTQYVFILLGKDPYPRIGGGIHALHFILFKFDRLELAAFHAGAAKGTVLQNMGLAPLHGDRPKGAGLQTKAATPAMFWIDSNIGHAALLKLVFRP